MLELEHEEKIISYLNLTKCAPKKQFACDGYFQFTASLIGNDIRVQISNEITTLTVLESPCDDSLLSIFWQLMYFML